MDAVIPDDPRARIVARYAASWLSLTRALPNPEREDICRALGAHSPTLRRWNLWSIWSTLLLVGGLVALVIGAAGLVLGDAVPWSLVATLFGAAALSWSGVVMWRLTHQATDVIVGLYLSVLPPDAQPLAIDLENRS